MPRIATLRGRGLHSEVGNTRRNWTGLLATFALGLSGCYDAATYEGDGHLTDRGLMDPNWSYVLDLGVVDLSRTGRMTFKMRHLPHVEFTVGLEMTKVESTGGSPENPYRNGQIRLTLESADNQTVISEDGDLDTWSWQSGAGEFGSFVYKRGKERETAVGQGVVRLDKMGLRPSSGWGTYFISDSSMSYTLILDVIQPPNPERPARLLLLSAGWK